MLRFRDLLLVINALSVVRQNRESTARRMTVPYSLALSSPMREDDVMVLVGSDNNRSSSWSEAEPSSTFWCKIGWTARPKINYEHVPFHTCSCVGLASVCLM